MEDLIARKKFLRKEMRSRRAALSKSERELFSREVVEKFLAQPIYQNSTTIFAYISMPEEIQLQEIFVDAFSKNKIVAVPVIVGKGEMVAAELPNFDALEIGDFGIFTVRENLRRFVDAKNFDCVIVPGAAFDIRGNRLGLGGGYYDRFLPRAVNAKKIALAFDFQIVESLPAESHDTPVDMIITPTKIFQNLG